tara:strand:- start:26 stop:193 length:168 start_codon:yes stop_codon:yes gene_type:complete
MKKIPKPRETPKSTDESEETALEYAMRETGSEPLHITDAMRDRWRNSQAATQPNP